jgi:uncharacterized protein DUF5818
MRRLILLTSLLLLLTGWVLAQSQSQYGSAAGQDTHTATSQSSDQADTSNSVAPQSNDTDNLGTSSSQTGNWNNSQQGSMSSSEGGANQGQNESSGGKTVAGEGMSSDQGAGNESMNEGTSSSSMHEGGTSGSMHHGSTASSSTRAITGCLSNDNGQYTLTDSAGNTYQLTGKSTTLKAHVGHKVRVRGRISSGTETASGSHPGSMSGGQGETFRVTSIQHLSNSCNMQGGSGAH